jgi:hypothetical protein
LLNHVGGSPTASHFLLTAKKESNPRKRHPNTTGFAFPALLNIKAASGNSPKGSNSRLLKASFMSPLLGVVQGD